MTAANEQQRTYWNEDAGQRWVTYQERLDRQILGAGLAAMDAAKVTSSERVLDIGCGCGATSLELARRVGTGSVLGADISGPMLARARERAAAAGIANAVFVEADAQTFPFGAASFDLAFSRFGVMFFEDPIAAFTNIRSALRPGGRLCFACWRPIQENPWILIPMIAAAAHIELPPPPAPGEPGPFAFGDADRVRNILSSAGFHDTNLTPYDQKEGFGESVEDTVDFLQYIGPLSRLFKEAGEDKKAAALAAVRKALEPYAGPKGVATSRAMWIVGAVNPG